MPHDMMTRCERRTKYKTDSGYEVRWKDVPVAHVVDAASSDLRCGQCYGEVRVHREEAETGPQEHVVHRFRADSQGCRGGHTFQGEHKMSAKPVK